jgi:hypothetical protein
MFRESTVFVVDDEDLARKAVCALAQSMGIRTESFASPIDSDRSQAVRADHRPSPLHSWSCPNRRLYESP